MKYSYELLKILDEDEIKEFRKGEENLKKNRKRDRLKYIISYIVLIMVFVAIEFTTKSKLNIITVAEIPLISACLIFLLMQIESHIVEIENDIKTLDNFLMIKEKRKEVK